MLRIMTALAATGALLGPATAPEPTGPPPSPAAATTERPVRSGYGWPTSRPHRVVRDFAPPETEYGAGHRGVDLAAPAGAPIRAAGAGVVIHAGPIAGRGVISVEHPSGVRTTYEPVRPEVAEGGRVTRGQRIGRLDPGHPECATRSDDVCLHWGAKREHEADRGGRYLDPLSLLGHGTVHLLPWTPAPRDRVSGVPR